MANFGVVWGANIGPCWSIFGRSSAPGATFRQRFGYQATLPQRSGDLILCAGICKAAGSLRSINMAWGTRVNRATASYSERIASIFTARGQQGLMIGSTHRDQVRFRAKMGRNRPNFAETGPKSAEVGQTRSKSPMCGRLRPRAGAKRAAFGRSRPKLVDPWQQLADIGPSSVEIGQMRSNPGQVSPNPGQSWPKSGKRSSNQGQVRPNQDQSCSNLR